jgi:hypothetical protein
MGSYADAFGYTPDDFMRMTLPQIASFSKYMEERDKKIKSGSSNKSKPGQKMLEAPDKQSSIEALVMQFGTPEYKQKLMQERIEALRKRGTERDGK